MSARNSSISRKLGGPGWYGRRGRYHNVNEGYTLFVYFGKRIWTECAIGVTGITPAVTVSQSVTLDRGDTMEPMSEEKPLHVRVAEALGCKVRSGCCGCGYGTSESRPGIGYRHGSFGGPEDDSDPQIANYATDWSATGPLIEQYIPSLFVDALRGRFRACRGQEPYEGWGDTQLVAVCNLLLALAAAGKLESHSTVGA